jgi:hypothetical protein
MPWRNLRREERRPLFDRVLVSWEENGQTIEAKGRCLNISSFGLGIETWDPVPDRADVTCTVLAVDLLARCKVRHSRRKGLKQRAGLEFAESLD